MALGKWIAGAIGWAMFGPLGGLLGYFLGSRLERLAEAAAGYDGSQGDPAWNQGQRNSFLISLLALSAAVIKARILYHLFIALSTPFYKKIKKYRKKSTRCLRWISFVKLLSAREG